MLFSLEVKVFFFLKFILVDKSVKKKYFGVELFVKEKRFEEICEFFLVLLLRLSIFVDMLKKFEDVVKRYSLFFFFVCEVC